MTAAPSRCPRRSPGTDRGQSTVLALTLTFVFMVGALVWLSTTVDESIHDRGQAAAVAFQAARSGAQQIDREAAFTGTIALDRELAVAAARAAAQRMLDANADTGRVDAIAIDGLTVTVTVTITTTGRAATGTASATAVAGIDGPGT